MDDLSREDFERYLESQKEWTEAIKNIRQEAPVSTASSGNMTLNLNAGGWSVLLLLVLASFVLGISVVSSFSMASRMNNMERRQDRQDDYISTIYRYAPDLPKPKEK